MPSDMHACILKKTVSQRKNSKKSEVTILSMKTAAIDFSFPQITDSKQYKSLFVTDRPGILSLHRNPVLL